MFYHFLLLLFKKICFIKFYQFFIFIYFSFKIHIKISLFLASFFGKIIKKNLFYIFSNFIIFSFKIHIERLLVQRYSHWNFPQLLLPAFQ